MKEVSLLVQINFCELARKRFVFPLNNSIRTSFWLVDSNSSTFSEVTFNDSIELNKNYNAKIKLVYRDFLKNKLNEKTNFEIGTYPEMIAKGIIIEVL